MKVAKSISSQIKVPRPVSTLCDADSFIPFFVKKGAILNLKAR